MNSAMQCIVNQKHLHDYFVKEKLYLHHLNLESVLGYKGDLAVAFANLMGQMWNANQVVVPRGFKH
jgi:ubiquitin C-terminal hydrolase